MANPIDDIDNILMKLRGAQVEPTDLTSWNNTRTAIKNLLLEARLDGQLMALNSFYNAGEIGSDSYKMSVKQIADRLTEFKGDI